MAPEICRFLGPLIYHTFPNDFACFPPKRHPFGSVHRQSAPVGSRRNVIPAAICIEMHVFKVVYQITRIFDGLAFSPSGARAHLFLSQTHHTVRTLSSTPPLALQKPVVCKEQFLCTRTCARDPPGTHFLRARKTYAGKLRSKLWGPPGPGVIT